jgi:hypothetical protein
VLLDGDDPLGGRGVVRLDTDYAGRSPGAPGTAGARSW